VDYLNGDSTEEFSSHGIFANARQILEQFNASISSTSQLNVIIIVVITVIAFLNWTVFVMSVVSRSCSRLFRLNFL